VLLNQCPHNLDLLQWFCGMPSKVFARCHLGKWHDIEVEDACTAYLEYPNGATGVFITTTGEAPGTNRLEVACERGRIVVEGDHLAVARDRHEGLLIDGVPGHRESDGLMGPVNPGVKLGRRPGLGRNQWAEERLGIREQRRQQGVPGSDRRAEERLGVGEQRRQQRDE
jgi:predicted dehydrogenase